MTIRTLRLTTVALGAALLGMVGSASAGLVPVFVAETNTANSSVFIYNISFTTNGNTESLTSGDFFTMYDIGTPSAFSLSGPFTFSQQLTGMTAPLTAPPDSASILNLTATYTGATLTADTTFTETLTYPGTVGTRIGFYSSTDSISSGKNGQAGQITLPSAVVPEPSTWALLSVGAGLVAFGVSRRRGAQTT